MVQIPTPTILIIDDSATNRRIYSKLAHQVDLDIKVCSFGHPEEAIDWLSNNSADLIITDYKMPGMTGDKLVMWVRSQCLEPDIPIIVVTAYNDRAFRVLSLDAGATDFLLSPIDHVEFVTRARNLLKLRKQQRLLINRANLLERKLEISLTAQEDLLRESREALAQVIDSTPAMISAADRNGKCVFVNALQAAAVGAMPDELVGQSVELFFGTERAASNRRLDGLVIETGQPIQGREEEVLSVAGEVRVYLTSKVPLHDSRGVVVNVLTTSVDITEQRNAERRLQHMVNHDALTGLPNRTMLRDRIRRALARGRRSGHHFALHFIDLDRFKVINDSYGHERGNEVLCHVAEALLAVVGEGDTVARIGGDEFVVLQPTITGPKDAALIAKNIIARLNQTDGMPGALTVGASIGITLSPQDGNDPDELIKNSDQAMYSAKSNGGNTWQFFAADMRPRANRTAQLEADLRGAISRQEFVLHYQPQIDLRRRAIVGTEALLRWQCPSRGLVAPSAFLGLAEETGLIVQIDEWVLKEACRQAMAWEKEGISGLRMAVNLSPIQFRRKNLHNLVVETIAATGIQPHLLELELTESVLLADTDDVISQLHALRELGVSLSLDDFGTGYSSLNYIRKFPIDRLKIDRSFVQGLTSNRSDLAIMRTIIDLGHILRLRVLAEGVETGAQLALLQAEGCDEVQGLHFSAAVPPAMFSLQKMRQWLIGLPAASLPVVKQPC